MKIRFIKILTGFIFLISSLFWLGTGKGNDTLPNSKPAVTIGMTNSLSFDPDTVHIKVGETVRWKNTSLLVHSATGDPSEATIEESASLPDGAQPFNSGLLDPDQTFEHTFKVAGTYNYFCIPHEAMMRGVIIVEK